VVGEEEAAVGKVTLDELKVVPSSDDQKDLEAAAIAGKDAIEKHTRQMVLYADAVVFARAALSAAKGVRKEGGGAQHNLCDCERSHNGLGFSGRECDCPASTDVRSLRAQLIGALNSLTSLRLLLAEAVEGMEPFADFAEQDVGVDEADEDMFLPAQFCPRARPITIGDLRRARILRDKIKKALAG
jgi:hypothetical protein